MKNGDCVRWMEKSNKKVSIRDEINRCGMSIEQFLYENDWVNEYSFDDAIYFLTDKLKMYVPGHSFCVRVMHSEVFDS